MLYTIIVDVLHNAASLCIQYYMYTCIYVCMSYVCLYVCVHVCMYACMYVRMYVCMYVCIVCVCVCVLRSCVAQHFCVLLKTKVLITLC